MTEACVSGYINGLKRCEYFERLYNLTVDQLEEIRDKLELLELREFKRKTLEAKRTQYD